MQKNDSRASSCRAAGTFLVLSCVLLVGACRSSSLSDGLEPTGSTVPVQQSSQQLRPEEPIGNESALAPEPELGASATAALERSTDPAVAQVPPVAFLPVTGAPQSTVTTLAGSMRRAAQEQAVPVVVSAGQGAQYQIKGYFSALNDGGGTLLVYVWDILDRNGTRIHRISGQERSDPVSGGDPWSGISDDVIDRVAQTTMSSLRYWMQTRPAG